MTDYDVASKQLRPELTGFNGCSGEQPFLFKGGMRDAGMGFEQSKSSKSSARNMLENYLRLDQGRSSAGLREKFAQVAERHGAGQAAPLLSDVTLLSYMGDDLREHDTDEATVRCELKAALTVLLSAKGLDSEAALRDML